MVGILDSYQHLSIMYHFVSSYCNMDCYLKALQIKLFFQKCIHINNGTQHNIIKTLELKIELKQMRIHRRTGICKAKPSHKKKIKKDPSLCLWFFWQLLACLVSRILFPILLGFLNFKLNN